MSSHKWYTDGGEVDFRNMQRSNANGMPWWVRAAVLLGVPAVIALYLTYTIVSVYSGEHKAIVDALQQSIGQAQRSIELHYINCTTLAEIAGSEDRRKACTEAFLQRPAR